MSRPRRKPEPPRPAPETLGDLIADAEARRAEILRRHGPAAAAKQWAADQAHIRRIRRAIVRHATRSEIRPPNSGPN